MNPSVNRISDQGGRVSAPNKNICSLQCCPAPLKHVLYFIISMPLLLPSLKTSSPLSSPLIQISNLKSNSISSKKFSQIMLCIRTIYLLNLCSLFSLLGSHGTCHIFPGIGSYFPNCKSSFHLVHKQSKIRYLILTFSTIPKNNSEFRIAIQLNSNIWQAFRNTEMNSLWKKYLKICFVYVLSLLIDYHLRIYIVTQAQLFFFVDLKFF